ncbi:unnamed protein product [Oikopleura dioica]|uniref:Carbonic anhydrase n=1 Tax=Oikopleura dioica TaxID=34765 RepID=E4XVW1_OIKDI|nr:unnamed protein product [Oikopleura dioica]
MKVKHFALGITVAAVSESRHRRAAWTYADQGANWEAPDCSGSAQSPIDITGDFKHEDHVPFERVNYDAAGNWTLVNSGYTIKMTPSSSDIKVSGGALEDDPYMLAQFHLHWGSAEEGGSEHVLEGKRFYSELHIVHYKAEYGGLAEALSHKDGLAVLGFFIDSDEANEEGAFDEFIMKTVAKNVEEAKSTMEIKDFSMNKLLPSELKDFYRYAGSLTTPTCNEAVVWTVFSEPIKITKSTMEYMNSFTKDAEGELLENNYRVLQPRNERDITHYMTGSHDHPASHDHSDENDPASEPEPQPEGEPKEDGAEDKDTDAEPEPEGSFATTFNSAALISLFILLQSL